MAKHQVRFEEFFPAPRENIFAFFADHTKFGKIWGGKFERIQDGQNPKDPNGLGSVRKICSAGMTFEETIISYQPATLIEYTVTRGGPVKNHLGRIEFKDAPGGTKLEYTISFDPKIPFTGIPIEGILKASWKKGVGNVMKNL